jgi:mevalonate kinase
MSRIKGTKSSAALLVAVIALVAALGGGAVAGVTISKLNKKERKQVKRLSKKQAKKLDRRIELLPGPRGPAGPKGDTGSAAAFAHVEYTGTVTESRSSNVSDANISHPSPGVYCVGGLNFDIRHAQVTPEVVAVGGEADKVAHILLANPGASSPFGCSEGEELRVQIFDPSSGVFTDHPFYLLLED